jgi:hypothetical protein
MMVMGGLAGDLVGHVVVGCFSATWAKNDELFSQQSINAFFLN